MNKERDLFKFIKRNVLYSYCSVDEGGLVGYSLAFLSMEQDSELKRPATITWPPSLTPN
jgi:hypothetical protein